MKTLPCDHSAEGKGTYRLGVTSFAYIPLSAISPKESPSLVEGVAQKIDDAKRDHKLPSGLAEQLDVQLEILRNDTLPDLEIVAVPCYLVAPSECHGGTVTNTSDVCQGPPEPGKSYATLSCIVQHPFSRGYIVNCSSFRTCVFLLIN
jgi:hypothetical protein